MSVDGLRVLKSRHDPATTLERAEASIARNGMKVVALIDHGALAEAAGVEMRPTAVLMFGSARAGAPTVQATQTLAIDLQWGIAYGAPYATRSGVGAVLLGGAERVAATTVAGAWSAWRATGSLGLRLSAEVGSVDLWAGPELVVRSGPSETLGATDSSIPQLSGMFSVGCLFPAFGITRRDDPVLYAVEQSSTVASPVPSE